MTACYVCVFFFSHAMPVDVRVIVFYYIYKAFAGCTDTKSQHTRAFLMFIVTLEKTPSLRHSHVLHTASMLSV